MENPFSSPKTTALKRFKAFLSDLRWTRVGIVTVLAVVALFFVLSGIGQPRVSAFLSVDLYNPTFAARNDHGTVIVDSARSRLVFVDSNNELLRIVNVDNGEIPIDEVSHVLLAEDGVVVSGATRSEDGETIASESVLHFGYDGTYGSSLWNAIYLKDSEGKDSKGSKKEQGEKSEDKSEKEEINAYLRGFGTTIEEAHFEPTIMDLRVDQDGSSQSSGVFVVRSTGHATAGTEVEIHRVSIEEKDTEGSKKEDAAKDSLYSKPNFVADEYVHDVRFLPNTQRCIALGDWGSAFVASALPVDSEKGQVDGAGGYVLHAGSGQERYALFDALDDSAVAYDCVASRLVRFDNISSGKPQKTVIDNNVEVKSISFNGSKAIVVLKNDEIRSYDVSNGTYEVMTTIYPEMSVKVHNFIMDVSWLYLYILVIVLVVSTVRRALREGRQDKLRRGIIAFMSASIFVGILLYSFYMTFTDSVSTTVMQLSHASAIVGYTSPSTIGDTTKREVQVIESGGQGVALEEHNAIKSFLEEFSASSYNNGVGMQSAIYGVSSDGSHVYSLGASQRESITGSEVTDQEIREGVLEAMQDAASYASYNSVNEISFAISADNPVHQSFRNSSDGYLFTCYVPIVASDGSCHAVLEVSHHFESFWAQQTRRLLETILTLALLTIGIYYASNELIQSGKAVLRYRELHKNETWWAGALLTRPINFLVTLATGIDAALAIVLARDMLASQGVDSNAFLWGVPALAITLGDLLGTIITGHFAGRMPGRTYALRMMRVGIVAQCLCVVAVGMNSFVLFVVGKLFAGMGYTATSGLMRSLAFCAEGEDRGTALQGLAARMPAGIFAGVLGGLLSSIGSTWLYLVAAVVGAIAFVLLRKAMPPDVVLVKMDQELGAGKLVKFVFSKKMIITALFVMIPITLTGGYRKFILPLLLDSSGLSKQQIANLFVIADVVLYVANSTMREYKRSHDAWKMTWTSLLILSVTFLLFSFNQSPWLAVLTVVVVSVVSFFAKCYKKTAAIWAYEDYGYDRVRTYAALHVEDVAIKNLRAPVLGALQILGGGPCCVVLGGIVGACGVLYAFASRQYRPKPRKK